MRISAWLFVTILLPVSAFALDYTNTTLLYTDAPFAPAESAAISVLTNLHAVEGNPDGTFRPERTLNRAEFLKIVLASAPNIRVSLSDAANCFPDVRQQDWFSPYVCLAQKRGIVSGYPDGTFGPANPVNYAEALKMLGELYEVMRFCAEESSTDGCIRWSDYREQYPSPWYASYAQVAADRGTALPINLSYATPLTRGQMARLAAAYRADHDGELGRYRAAERGEYVPVQSSASSVSSASTSASSVSSTGSSVSSSSSASSVAMFGEPQSQALVLGEQSEPIVRGMFTPWTDDVIIRIAEIELDKEVKSFKALHLVNQTGEKLGTFTLDIYDQENETWKAYFQTSDNKRLPKGQQTRLGVVADVKTSEEGGFSGEWVQVMQFIITVQNAGDGQSSTIVAADLERPPHLVTLGKITGVENTLGSGGTLKVGSNRKVARFAFSGSTLEDDVLHVEQLLFDLERSFGLELGNWSIGRPGVVDRQPCFMQGPNRVSCSVIPENHGRLHDGQVELELFADVDLAQPSDDRTLQVFLIEPGTISAGGAVWWNDDVTRVTWIETDDRPMSTGPLWTIREN
jgi:hypothetical protein